MKEIIISLKLRTNNIKTILFGIVMIVWYIYFCWGAVTVGETLRSQTLHDWQKKELKQVCFYRITGE